MTQDAPHKTTAKFACGSGDGTLLTVTVDVDDPRRIGIAVAHPVRGMLSFEATAETAREIAESLIARAA